MTRGCLQVREYLKKMSVHLEELAIEMETMKGQHELVSRIMDLHDTNRDGVIDENEYYKPTSASSREELWSYLVNNLYYILFRMCRPLIIDVS